MKQKVMIILCLVFAIAHSQSAFSQYFPLEVGSTWGYKYISPWHQDDSTDLVITAERVINFNGNKYVRFNQYFGFGNKEHPAFRKDELGQVHVLVDNEDRILYKFNAALGDTWEVDLDHTTATVTKCNGLGACFSFFVGIDYAWEQHFSWGVGLTCQENIGIAGASYYYLTYFTPGSNPYVMTSPCTLNISLPANQQSTESLVIYNNGDSNLHFTISESQSQTDFKPDLLIAGAFLGLPPGWASIPELHWATIKVANYGSEDVQNVAYRCTFDNLPEHTGTIPEIPACSIAYITTSYWFSMPPPQWADVSIDPSNLIDELDESNNIDHIFFFPSWFYSAPCPGEYVSWLLTYPYSGTVASAESAVVQVLINTVGLSEGEYEAFLLIDCYTDTSILVPVHLTVLSESSVTEQETQTPDRFEVYQNYPNPFNPQTIIQYTIPQDYRVTVIIHNLLGQKVRTLLDEDQTAGFKRVTWDGRSDQGEEMASGIYFLSVQADEILQVRKMVLVR